MNIKNRIIHKRLTISLLLTLLFTSLAMAGDPQIALNTLLKSSSLTSSKTAILIYDLATGETIIEHNISTPIVPASVMKCVSAAALTSKMPYNYRFETKIYTTGNISNGTLNGNIIVVGSGDPSLNTFRGAGESDIIQEIVDALKENGINRVEGKIIVDNSYIDGPAVPEFWTAGDQNAYYGTGYHAFNFEGNASGKSAVRRPDEVFISKLKQAMSKQGITLGDQTLADSSRKLLATHQSQILENIMRSCIFRSDNMYAESFLRLFGKASGTNGATVESAQAAMDYWTRGQYPMEAVNIVDGSGLSRNNRLTADFLGEVLGRHSDDAVYVSLFPLTGEEGTVRNFTKGTPLAAYMALKTGSMNGIQSYAGFKLNERYEPTHVVVVMSNDLKNRDKFRADLTKFFMEIFEDQPNN